MGKLKNWWKGKMIPEKEWQAHLKRERERLELSKKRMDIWMYMLAVVGIPILSIGVVVLTIQTFYVMLALHKPVKEIKEEIAEVRSIRTKEKDLLTKQFKKMRDLFEMDGKDIRALERKDKDLEVKIERLHHSKRSGLFSWGPRIFRDDLLK